MSMMGTWDSTYSISSHSFSRLFSLLLLSLQSHCLSECLTCWNVCSLSLTGVQAGLKTEESGTLQLQYMAFFFVFSSCTMLRMQLFFLYPWWQHARCNHKREGRRWKALPHHLLAERHCVYKSRIGRSGGGFLLQPGWLGSCDTTSSIAWYYPDSITLTWLWIKNYLLDLREGKWWVSHQQLLRTHRRVHGAQPDRESAPGGGASLVGLSLVQLRCLLGRLVSFQAGGVPVRHSPPPLTVMLRIDH